MSQIIKIARFIIIQMTFQLMNENYDYAEDEQFDLLNFVIKMMNKFMIRDNQKIMQ